MYPKAALIKLLATEDRDRANDSGHRPRAEFCSSGDEQDLDRVADALAASNKSS
jgi:hypothetical protein